VPLFHSWAEIAATLIQVGLFIGALFAKRSFDQLRATLIANKLNPKLRKNIENSIDSAKQNFSETMILERESFLYFQRICQNMLDLNRLNRRSYRLVLAVWWYKMRILRADHSHNRGKNVLRVWRAFDVYVEGWKTRFVNDEQVRQVGSRYAP